MRRIGSALVLGAGLLLPAIAEARYDENDAMRACERYIAGSYGYNDFRNVNVTGEGHHDYTVRGNIPAGNKRFVCNILHKDVVNVKILDADRKNDDDTDAAIGAGLVGLALLAVAAASLDGNDTQDQPHEWQYGGDPFDDLSQLQDACAHELRRHLKADHGRVDSFHLTTAQLHNRDLRGSAHVLWADGDVADLNYTCQFDRQGRIYDGEYRYATRTSGSVTDAMVVGTQFNATGNVPCARSAGQPMGSCKFGVNRSGGGDAMLTVFWPDGGNRVIFFENGKVSGVDSSQADGNAQLFTEKNADLFMIRFGDQRFEIPEAAVFGG